MKINKYILFSLIILGGLAPAASILLLVPLFALAKLKLRNR